MTTSISTGLAKALLDTGSMRTNLTGIKLKIYAGTIPLSANAASGVGTTSTLLCTISDASGAGALTFEAAAIDNVLEKTASQVWSGVNVATGVATFFRFEMTGDAGGASTTAVRIQGAIGTAGKELNLSSVSLTSGATQTIDYYAITQPVA